MAPEKEKRPRMDEQKKAVFLKLFHHLDGGRFRKIVQDGDTSKNMMKSEAWARFTLAFNSKTGENFDKSQLKNYYQSEKKKASTAVGKRNADDLNLSRVRRDYAVTGGGPATSESLNGMVIYINISVPLHINV